MYLKHNYAITCSFNSVMILGSLRPPLVLVLNGLNGAGEVKALWVRGNIDKKGGRNNIKL